MSFTWRKWALGMALVSAAAVSCTQDFNVFQFQEPSGAGASATVTSTGSAGECSGPDTCPQGNSCNRASCIDGKCDFQLQTAGAACTDDGGQVCDGLGACVECNKNSDCDGNAAKPLCDKKKKLCVSVQCMNTVKDGAETDVDCGGTDQGCGRCADGKICLLAADCNSNLCKGDAGGGGAGGAGGMASGPGVCAPCATSADCGAGAYCTDMKACAPHGTQGDVCVAGDECASGFCVDGRCCDTACDGTCVACSNAKSGGKDGECTVFKQGDDLDMECVDSKPAACGPALDKGCSGAALDPAGTTSSCEVWDAMTSCTTASCDTGKNEQTAAANCDGKGACPMPVKTSCGSYVCDAMNTACLKDCTSNKEANCNLDSYCDTTTCKACGPNANPPGLAQCPSQCSSCTANNLCIKNCAGNACDNFVCPDGYDCLVNCASNDVCKNATITCPNTYDCSIECASTGACEGATLKASGTGTMGVHCGNQGDACKNTKVNCGVNECKATCDGMSKPSSITGCGNTPDKSCKCTTATCQ